MAADAERGRPLTSQERAGAPGPLFPYRFEVDTKLFVSKVLVVVLLSFGLVPLIIYKERISAVAYAAVLVGLHVLILVAYCWKVRIRSLDADWRAVVARVLALAASLFLLSLATHIQASAGNLGLLCTKVAALCVVHMAVLALLSIRSVHTYDKVLEPLVIDPTTAGPAAAAVLDGDGPDESESQRNDSDDALRQCPHEPGS